MVQVPIVRADVLKTFQFRMKFLNPPAAATPGEEAAAQPGGPATGGGSGYIAGVARVSGLSASISAQEIWSGGNMLHRYAQPDRCTWDPITLEQGLAKDHTLFNWARSSIQFVTTGQALAGEPVKRTLVLDVWDPWVVGSPQASNGDPGAPPTHPIYRYHVHNAWVSRLEAMPALDAMSNDAAFLKIEVTHEGWFGQPVEPGDLPEIEPLEQNRATFETNPGPEA